MATQRKKQGWVVTVSGDRPIHDVKKALQARGLEQIQVLENIGSITGVAGSDAAKTLRNVPGVADVSEDHAVNIGPPDAPVS
jgi:hypothetical protein